MHHLRPLTFLIVLAFVACGSPADDVAAHVGRDRLTNAQLDRELEAIAANPEHVREVERRNGASIRAEDGRWTRGFVAGVLTRRVHETVVAIEVAARDLRPANSQRERGTVTAAEEAGGMEVLEAFPAWYRRELVERGTRLAMLRDDTVEGLTPERYYAAHRDDFVKPCSRHIVVGSRPEAEAVIRRVENGEDFADVATDVSIDDGTAPKGGDLGCNGVGDLVEPLNSATLSQEIGEVGEPLETPDGWQVLLVYERETPSLSGIKGEVNAAIDALAKRRVGAALIERFTQTEVEISDTYGRWDPEQRKVLVT